MATTKPPGLLQFGSTDPSILLQCSLASSAAVTAAGGTDLGNNTFDPDLGMKSNGQTSATSGARFISIPSFATLDYAGQISFDIETAAIATTNTTARSVGAGWSSTNHILVCTSAAGVTDYFRIAMTASEVLFAGHVVGSATKGTNPNSLSPALLCHSVGKGRFTRVTYTWAGNNWALLYDGMPVYNGTSGGVRPPNFCTRINIFSPEGLGDSAMPGYYVKNLLVSNQPVQIGVHPGIGSLAFCGHSFAERALIQDWTKAAADLYYDMSIGMCLKRVLNLQYGIDAHIPFDNSLNFNSPGAYINSARSPKISDKVTLCAAAMPQTVVYMGGLNDTQANSLRATWLAERATVLADLKTQLSTLLAAPNTRTVILCDVTSTICNTSAYAITANDASVQEINTDMLTIPAWWDAANPTRAGAIRIAKTFEAMGRDSTTNGAMVGSMRGTFDNAHPSPIGCYYHAVAIAEALMRGPYYS